ncbi:MAG TPA: efflux RND transporter periplasmic adaptor subunit [Oligoflexus sp.]|uniref:efflux RND transporter periplasmic adaptor subunit n=1 Tax=Oligoflexus sp. TaxID=1971216 RepID=UPI002D303F16|nr:efflux RND transporter periplasmic adaptor subunit [Oligoflexus sp.]HYX34905.1 efflux RND transporter periplasmic adaptor subunit [Oligoflexus sp.]
MKRNQVILWTSGLLLLGCTKSKVDLPATPPPAQPAALQPVETQPAATQPAATDAATGAQTAVNPAPAAATTAPATTPAANSAPASTAGTPAGQEGSVNTRLSGEVASQTKSQLSFRVSGFIQELKYKAGMTCKKGDVLAVLDTRDYRLSLDMARSQKEMARVALTNAQSEFQREEELKKANVSTESMFDKLKAGYDKARLDLQMADLKLTQANQAMQDTKLVAPYDCIVTKQLRNVGEKVNPGDAVFELYSTSDVEMNFQVPERMAGRIKVGDKIKVTIPATGFSGELEVIRLVPVVEQASRTFRVIAKAPDQDQRVVPGLYAEAQLL